MAAAVGIWHQNQTSSGGSIIKQYDLGVTAACVARISAASAGRHQRVIAQRLSRRRGLSDVAIRRISNGGAALSEKARSVAASIMAAWRHRAGKSWLAIIINIMRGINALT